MVEQVKAQLLVRLRNAIRELKKTYPIKDVWIFGSFLTESSFNDVDLLVEVGEGVSLLELVKMEEFLTRRLGVRVHLHTPSSISKHIRVEARPL